MPVEKLSPAEIEYNKGKLQAAFSKFFNARLKQNHDKDPMERRSELIKVVEISAEHGFPEDLDFIRHGMQSLSATSSEDFEFVENLANFLADNYANKYSLNEIEERLRKGSILGRGQEAVNRVLHISVHEDNIGLHLPPTFIENPLELRSQALAGFKKLAQMIKARPELMQKPKIIGKSYVVYQARKIFENFGFEVVKVDDKKGQAIAEISTKKFLELYS